MKPFGYLETKRLRVAFARLRSLDKDQNCGTSLRASPDLVKQTFLKIARHGPARRRFLVPCSNRHHPALRPRFSHPVKVADFLSAIPLLCCPRWARADQESWRLRENTKSYTRGAGAIMPLQLENGLKKGHQKRWKIDGEARQIFACLVTRHRMPHEACRQIRGSFKRLRLLVAPPQQFPQGDSAPV